MSEMRKMVFERYSFDDDALQVFARAEAIAKSRNEDSLECGHVFAGCAELYPEIIHTLLGRHITSLPDYLDLALDKVSISVSATPHEESGMDFSVELGMLFLEDHNWSPFKMVSEYVPGRPIGVAEIAFAIMAEPTEEISDILFENGFPNDAAVLEQLIRENYLARIREFSTESPRQRLSAAAARGEAFENFMKSRVCGEDNAISALTSLFTDFWCRGNQGRPLTILLLSKANGGRSFFAETMQRAMVELGLQNKVEPPLALSSFVHDSSCEVDLLGDARSFRNARCGKLHSMMESNPRGMMVFEDILDGSRNAKNVLCSFAGNHAYDKFYEEILLIPFNILVFTMKVTDDQYRFLTEKSEHGIDAGLLNALFLSPNDDSSRSLPDDAAAGTAGLWECADKIILLEQLPEEKLQVLAEDQFSQFEKRLNDEYGISFKCDDIRRVIRLILQSVPRELCPGELTDIIDKMFGSLCRTLNRNTEIAEVEICCPELPEYQYDPDRRIVRGDYLAFDREEQCDGNRLRLLIRNVRYTQQERVDCGSYRIEHPKGITFDDIVGLDHVKEELLDSLYYITGHERAVGKLPEPCLDFILYGPPGTGKTSLAVALANSADIPVFFASSSIFTEPKSLNAMFRKAKEMAPAIVVLDEFNSIGDSTITWKRDAVNELLAILDGVHKNSKLLVLASTNHLDQLEEGFLRSGRFGRQIKIDLPTAQARNCFIRKFEEKFEFSLADDVRNNFVESTDQVSLADLKGILGYALRASIRNHSRLDTDALTSALHKFKGEDPRQGIGFGRGGER